LAPKTKADFAFVQHMIYHLSDNGIMACVLPHGVLFRGSSEEVIRKYLIKDLNYLDAVIGLPSNIFYGTGIPTCILVLKKCREQDENIVFIDASGEGHFIKEGNQNTLRDEDVEMIVNTYRNRETIDKYSNVVSMQEIEENDYNLNIPRYVDTFEEEDDVDLEDVSSEIKKLEKDLSETNSIVLKYCQELNISTPF
jgi:type I restriction enzyme M protein